MSNAPTPPEHVASGPLSRARAGVSTALLEQRLSDSLFEGLWEHNLLTGDVWLSRGYLELLGLGPEAGAGSSAQVCERIRGWLHPDDRARLEAAMRELERLDTGRILDVGELRMRHGDGSWRWFRARLKLWPDADGRPAVMVGAIHDVHEEVLQRLALQSHQDLLEQRVAERTQRLEQAWQQAETERLAALQANRAKASFLAHMSHELRTPLNGMLGMAELAQHLARSEQQRRYLDLAQQSGRTLLRIVDDVLDFAKAEAGKIQLASETFDLARLLADVLRTHAASARAKHLSVLYDYIGVVTHLVGDPDRMEQAVGNLVNNAVKYTDRGEIGVLAEVTAEPAGECRVRIEVHDSGTGLDHAAQQRVFRPFEQGDDSMKRRHGGAGLGLSISRMLAQLMGGDVRVRSQPGKGSVFTLTAMLPMAAVQPLLGDTQDAPAPSGHAWLLGADPQFTEWTRRRLARFGWSCEPMSDVDAALAMATEHGPFSGPQSVIIMEAALTSPDDLAALRRALPRQAPMTLLLWPDSPLHSSQKTARRVGVNILQLPLAPADMRALLKPKKPAAALPAHRTASVFGRPALSAAPNVLVVEDNLVNQIIAQEMVSALGLRVEVVASGEEALVLCHKRVPDLVLMDIQMPGMDGLETTRRLRALQADGTLPPFPIVALSAHALETDREASLEAGMDEHLNKPVEISRLRSVLARWLTLPSQDAQPAPLD